MVKVEGLAMSAAKWDDQREWFESIVNVTLLTVGV
jgi:hypothetical protein